jgi:hypothetical protein
MQDFDLRTAFKDLKDWEHEEHKRLYTRLSDIEAKIDNLNEFKWKIVGASGVVGFVVSVFGAMLVSHLVGNGR